MRSTERVKAPLVCSILALIVNFCLNFILIYGRFGFPKLGVTGAAIGTLASSTVNVVALCFKGIEQIFEIDERGEKDEII
jgi:Na+-driven multidrug efflux pump